MRRVMTFALAVMLVMAMAVPAFAVNSPTAPVASETKTAALPVVVDTLSAGVALIPVNAAATLAAEAKETFATAQAELKAAAPAGMAVKYFAYVAVESDSAVTVALKIANVQSVTVMQFLDGKWVELKCTLNADGTITIEGVVEGPIAIFTK